MTNKQAYKKLLALYEAGYKSVHFMSFDKAFKKLSDLDLESGICMLCIYRVPEFKFHWKTKKVQNIANKIDPGYNSYTYLFATPAIANNKKELLLALTNRITLLKELIKLEK